MIIRNLKKRTISDRIHLSVEVVYENVDAIATMEIYYSVPEKFAAYVSERYEAFLLAAYPAAYHHDEKRIYVQGNLCPELVANCNSAMLLQRKWYYNTRTDVIPKIESDTQHVVDAAKPEHAGCFLSGGVDSFSSFGRNVKIYPDDHPHRFKAAMCLYGLDMGDPNKPDCPEVFDQTIQYLRKLTDKYSVDLIPVYTNARLLEKNWKFYAEKHYGAILSGAAHFLGQKLTASTIALDNRVDYFYKQSHGSHPLFNKYLSSSYITLRSSMDSFTRIEKYQFFKDIPEALGALRTCYNIGDIDKNHINCGHCGKCVRTKMELMANGVLDKVVTFADKELTIEDVSQIKIFDLWHTEYYEPLVKAMRELGRNDLADVLAQELKKPTALPGMLKRLKRALASSYKILFKPTEYQ